MPDTIWAATREPSYCTSETVPMNPYCESSTKSAAPPATRALVRKPAIRARH